MQRRLQLQESEFEGIKMRGTEKEISQQAT